MIKLTHKEKQDLQKKMEAPLLQVGAKFQYLEPEQILPIEAEWIEAFLSGQAPRRRTDYEGECHFDVLVRLHPHKLLIGFQAIAAYQKQHPAEYVIFLKNAGYGGYRCSGPYPDYSSLGMDIYLSHHNMKWTMVWTHEPGGPLFCTKANL